MAPESIQVENTSTLRHHLKVPGENTQLSKVELENSVFPWELSLTISFSNGNSKPKEHQRQTALLEVPLHRAVAGQLRACVQVSPSACQSPLPAVSEKHVCSAVESLDCWEPFWDQTQTSGRPLPSNRSTCQSGCVFWTLNNKRGRNRRLSSHLFRFSLSTSKV